MGAIILIINNNQVYDNISVNEMVFTKYSTEHERVKLKGKITYGVKYWKLVCIDVNIILDKNRCTV